MTGKRSLESCTWCFFNVDKYATFAEAVTHPDGLAVVGRWIEQSESPSVECEVLKEMISKIPTIPYNDDKPAAMAQPIHLPLLLPQDTTAYYSYPGSLTTPPCNECVTWIMYRDPMKFSEAQLNMCRRMYMTGRNDAQQIPCMDTNRPPCPLGNRLLRTPYQ